MTSRRGLTLLEVLLATVLLATIAATCAPMLQHSLAILSDDRENGGGLGDTRMLGTGVERADLVELADALVADPPGFDIDLDSLSTATIAWPNDLDRPPVEVERLVPSPTDEQESEGSWLVLTCGPWHIHRYLPPPAEGANGHPRVFSEGDNP